MLSRPQQILLKRAQREVALSDEDYRDALDLVSGLRSSRDRAMNDRNLDKILAYFEAIYWHKVESGALQPPGSPNAVFRKRAYWASKNTAQETSRDRFNGDNLGQAIADLERGLADLGFGREYCAGIRSKSTHGRTDAHALHLYRTALQRTFDAKPGDLKPR